MNKKNTDNKDYLVKNFKQTNKHLSNNYAYIKCSPIKVFKRTRCVFSKSVQYVCIEAALNFVRIKQKVKLPFIKSGEWRLKRWRWQPLYKQTHTLTQPRYVEDIPRPTLCSLRRRCADVAQFPSPSFHCHHQSKPTKKNIGKSFFFNSNNIKHIVAKYLNQNHFQNNAEL